MIPGFKEQIKILSEEGVDLIILEAMSSQADIVETIIECSSNINLPVWLSISCVIEDKNKKVMLGYNDTVDSDTHIYESFEVAINTAILFILINEVFLFTQIEDFVLPSPFSIIIS